MFNSQQAQSDLIAAIGKLDPFNIPIRTDPVAVEGRGAYIVALGKLVANHIEAMAADGAASVCDRIDETSAQAITDITGDLGGALKRAAETMLEAV